MPDSATMHTPSSHPYLPPLLAQHRTTRTIPHHGCDTQGESYTTTLRASCLNYLYPKAVIFINLGYFRGADSPSVSTPAATSLSVLRAGLCTTQRLVLQKPRRTVMRRFELLITKHCSGLLFDYPPPHLELSTLDSVRTHMSPHRTFSAGS